MGQSRTRGRLVAAVLVSMLLVSAMGSASLSAAGPDAPSNPVVIPPSRDTTVPRDPTRTVSSGSQTVQVQPIRRTRTASGRDAVADRIIVGFKAGVSDAEKDAVHQTVARNQRSFRPVALKPVSNRAQYLDVTGAPSLDAAIQEYLKDPRVAYAEPDYVIRTTETPNDQYFRNQYALSTISAPAAWDVTHGLATVKIAILDCGISEAHPDLTGKVVARQDFTSSPYGTDDQCNHGTHVAGIASADTNNTTGVAGVAYNTSLLNGKVLLEEYDSNGAPSGVGSTTWITSGIYWAVDNGANVINLSLGAEAACEQAFQDAIDYAWSKNVVVVAAAGNDGINGSFEPADCAHTIAVASTDATDTKSSFSNYGPWVQVAAPGSGIFSTVNKAIGVNNNQDYRTFSGTSMASPHVAGLVGLLWSTSWGTSAQAVVDRLEATADPIAGTGTNWQYGRINAAAAVSAGNPPPVVASLSPNTLPVGNAAFTLTVNGYHFQPGATVRWNGVARLTTRIGPSQLTAAISATDLLVVGVATISVVNPDGQIAPVAQSFVIASPPPRPLGITPTRGNISGGTTVTISGTGFQTGATVTIGGAAASVSSVSDTQIVAVVPPHTVGSVDVDVTNPDSQSQTLAGAFTYINVPDARPAPAIPSTTPSTNPTPRSADLPGSVAGSSAPAPLPPSR